MMTTKGSRSSKGFGIGMGVAAVVALAMMSLPGSASGQASVGAVTFTEDVAPLLQQNCQGCHRPGSIGPMPLLTYEQVKPYAPLIKFKVENRLMPPWHIDKTVGIQEFKNDISLSDEEIQTIVQWVDAGAPQGDPSRMPPAIVWPEYSDTWRLQETYGRPPDLVVTTDDYTVHANGQDQWFSSDVDVVGLDEERWIQAIEIRPSNPKAGYVFHHGNSSLTQIMANGEEESASLLGAAVGAWADIFPSDAGKLIRPGAVLSTEIHYFPIGEEVTQATMDLGLYFYPRGETPRFATRGAANYWADNTQSTRTGPTRRISAADAGGVRAVDIFIPPHGKQMLRGVYVLQQPGRIHNVRGHMHLRGKYQAVEAIYPDGRREVLSKINWVHNWHTVFNYADHVQPLLPKGTVLILTSWFDNTEANPSNPDPDQIVVFGRRSVDEMSHIWIGFTFFEQADFDQLVAERAELLKKKQVAQDR